MYIISQHYNIIGTMPGLDYCYRLLLIYYVCSTRVRYYHSYSLTVESSERIYLASCHNDKARTEAHLFNTLTEIYMCVLY